MTKHGAIHNRFNAHSKGTLSPIQKGYIHNTHGSNAVCRKLSIFNQFRFLGDQGNQGGILQGCLLHSRNPNLTSFTIFEASLPLVEALAASKDDKLRVLAQRGAHGTTATCHRHHVGCWMFTGKPLPK